ncbi:MAG: trigger factor [Planctomycetota bacterium]|jgi:trigger factor
MAEATATKEAAREVKIEDVGPAKKRLTITIPASTVDEKMREQMDTLASKAALPGFRRGKAPQKLLAKRFGTEVQSESKSQLIADAYTGVIEEHSLKPISEPEPVESLDELEVEKGKPLTFAVEVEVVPAFDLPDVAGLELTKPVFEVDDKAIDAELERQRLHLGRAEPVESDFKADDQLLGRATVMKAGQDEPIFQRNDVMVIHPGDADGGRGHVLGLLIDDLAGRLAGMKVGDTLTVETTGPEVHELEDIRGAKLTITFKVEQAARVQPASVDDVVKHYGLESETILREQIRLGLEQKRMREQAAVLHQQVHEHLIEAVDFDLPEKVSAVQVARALERQRIELQYRGLSPAEIDAKLAELRADSEAEARNRLKLFFILHRLAEHYGIEVSEQEINGRIAALAHQSGVRPERVRAEMAQRGQLSEVVTQIREHKTCDRLIELAKVTEIPADEWRKAAGKKSAASTTGSKKKTKKKTTKKTPSSKRK